MPQNGASLEALTDPKGFYNARFDRGYMHGFEYDVFERVRVRTIREIFGRLKAKQFSPTSILDYGCGEGRYIGEMTRIFPAARLAGCDISEVGLTIAKGDNPQAELHVMADETIPCADNHFDLVISIEVLEHVQDVGKAVLEIGRVLKPGGLAVITTPCANRFSGEWFQVAFRRGFEPSTDGYGRFCTDEPGHLRRLTDSHLREL